MGYSFGDMAELPWARGLVCNWLEAIDSEAEEASVVCSG